MWVVCLAILSDGVAVLFRRLRWMTGRQPIAVTVTLRNSMAVIDRHQQSNWGGNWWGRKSAILCRQGGPEDMVCAFLDTRIE